MAVAAIDQLEDLLIERHVDLDAEEPQQGDSLKNRTHESEELALWASKGREKVTESLLRNDVLAPHVVKFTPTHNPRRKCRRSTALVFAIAMSVHSLFRFSRVFFSLSHEATLDIETNMATSHVNNVSDFNSSSATSVLSMP